MAPSISELPLKYIQVFSKTSLVICNLGSVPRVADRIRSLSRLGLSNVVAVHGLSKLQEIIRVVRRTPRPGC